MQSRVRTVRSKLGYLFSCDSSSRTHLSLCLFVWSFVCIKDVFSMTLKLFNLQHCNIATLQHCNFATLQLCNFSTLQLCYFATLQHYIITTFNIATLKFGQNWLSNSWDIPDMDKCCQDKCWLDNYPHNGWHLLKKVPETYL